MLMDPLVSALNGSQTLISQGLRTLELCVDNLQPDFLYDHIQPVRAELMQALWQTLHNPDDAMAAVAYRVLGKFGGSNRKMLSTPQPVSFHDIACSDVLHLVLTSFLFPSSPSSFSLSSLPPRSFLFLSPLSFPLSLPSSQLTYHETLQEGAAISVSFPDAENSIDLPVGNVSTQQHLTMSL